MAKSATPDRLKAAVDAPEPPRRHHIKAGLSFADCRLAWFRSGSLNRGYYLSAQIEPSGPSRLAQRRKMGYRSRLASTASIR